MKKLLKIMKYFIPLVVFLSVFVFLTAFWLKKYFSFVGLDQLTFYLGSLRETVLSADTLFVKTYLTNSFLPAVFITIVLCSPIWLYLSERLPYKGKRICFFISKNQGFLSFFVVVFCVSFSLVFLPILELRRVNSNGYDFLDVYLKVYKHPTLADFKMPSDKRNLIIILLESVEKSYDEKEVFGENLIPNLSALTKDNTTLDGHIQVYETSWTFTSQLAFLCGISNQVYLNKEIRPYPNFLCWPELLQQKGYSTVWLQGSKLSFSQTGKFAARHGFDDLIGRDELLEKYKLPPKDMSGWGINDNDLFAFAKTKIKEVSDKKRPFFVMLSTIDTHFPYGYLSKECPKKYNDLRDSIKCTDEQVDDFLKWVRSQEFYPRTTIVIIGDHLAKNDNIGHMRKKVKNRAPYNVIINGAMSPQKIAKAHTTFDLAPTILNSLGIEVKNNQFGMGVSVYSPQISWIFLHKNKLKLKTVSGAQYYE